MLSPKIMKIKSSLVHNVAFINGIRIEMYENLYDGFAEYWEVSRKKDISIDMKNMLVYDFLFNIAIEKYLNEDHKNHDFNEMCNEIDYILIGLICGNN